MNLMGGGSMTSSQVNKLLGIALMISFVLLLVINALQSWQRQRTGAQP